MKILKNKVTKIEDDNGEVRYDKLIQMCVNQPKKGGFTVAEMRKRQRILDAVEKSDGDEIEFEDADVKTLQKCVEKMKWGVVHEDIIKFNDDVSGL